MLKVGRYQPQKIQSSHFKWLRQFVARDSDQLDSLSSFGHCAHFTFDDCFMLFYFTFVM